MDLDEGEDWRPGSFTKNFSWGKAKGLRQLFDAIAIGFRGRLEEVSREQFRGSSLFSVG